MKIQRLGNYLIVEDKRHYKMPEDYDKLIKEFGDQLPLEDKDKEENKSEFLKSWKSY